MSAAFEPSGRNPFRQPEGIDAVIAEWEQRGRLHQMVLDQMLPAQQGDSRPFPEQLPAALRLALERRGIETLYSHQAEAYERALAGEDWVVSTPTASGKSLCYNLAVLTRMLEDESVRALYLFPTKALSRDQEEAFRQLAREAGAREGAITYDGDTPGDARRAARERAGVILTNPDMLHAAILPHHTSWARFFSKLSYVVVDELHTYRGVFGSHLANVLRRLQRVARFHGSEPTFLMASATIGNPETHAARLIGRPVRAIEESGAPTGERRLLVYQPPIVNAELGIRASYLKSAVRLTMDLIRARVPTLVFGQSRNGVEVMLKYLRDRLPRAEVEPSAIQAYRGGYLPQKRREIEAGLREGRIRCVVATNALELGIDVGGLDAVVCAGYPGSLAQTWQRFGRAGRRSMGSLAVLVASSAPLDQFVAADPAYLTRAPVEEARIDPDNVEILIAHLKCAAFELPFEEGEPFGDLGPAPVGDALEFLARSEVLVPGVGGSGRRIYHWASNAYPANQISLRSASWDNFTIVELGPDRLLAEMDWRSTHTMLHEQAIYQHEAEQYQVERLDYDDHKAFVRKVECDYYTTAMTHSNVSVLEQDEAARVQLGEGAALGAGLGDVLVVQKVVGYKKIKFHTHENVGYGEVHLPEIEMHTTSFWLTFPESFVTSLERPRPVVIDALRGLSKAMHLVATIGLMVDPRDLGRTLGDHDEPGGPPGKAGGRGFDPTIFLYDQIPGGIGLAPRLFEQRELLLRRARQLVELCRCDDGCPACIGPAIGELQLTLRRRALILAILESLGVGALH